MKKLLLSALLLPFAGKSGHHSHQPGDTSMVEIRSGDWPIILEKDIEYPDTIYSIQFRDQQVMTSVSMDTVAFTGVQQVRYFGEALTSLKNGSNGDIARFKTYSLTRADKKFEGTWYILKDKYGMTSFQQPEADIMVKVIRGL